MTFAWAMLVIDLVLICGSGEGGEGGEGEQGDSVWGWSW